jgi:ribosome-associated protein
VHRFSLKASTKKGVGTLKFAGERLAERIATVADESQAKDVLILDLRGLTAITDYFVIASAETTVQVRAVTQAVVNNLAQEDIRYIRREGWDDTGWVLLDYGSVVVHIFLDEQREYYELERLWGDAPQRSTGELMTE